MLGVVAHTEDVNRTGYTEAEAIAVARKVMDENDLWNWRIHTDNSRSNAGWCSYGNRVICLSVHHIRNNTRDGVMQTILHEVAHALTPGAGHGPAWRAKAFAIGYRGARTLNVDETISMRSDAPWVGRCPNGHEAVPMYRKPKREKSCGRCSRRFDPAYLIVWTRRGQEAAAQVRVPVAAQQSKPEPVEPAWMAAARERGRAVIAANLAEQNT